MAKKKVPRLITYTASQSGEPSAENEKTTTLSRSSSGYRVRTVYTQLPMQVRDSNGAQKEDQFGEVQAVGGLSTNEESTEMIDFADEASSIPGNIEVHMRARRYENSDTPLATWQLHRQSYLDHVLALDGRGRFFSTCSKPGCTTSTPFYRCADCFGNHMLCKECIIDKHRDEPLHILEKWNGAYFEKVLLSDIGVSVQLGHPAGLCSFRRRAHKDFLVIDVNGIHTCCVYFCGCLGAPAEYSQLLEAGWWPSTHKEPRTVATMAVLKLFHTLNLQGQISPTDFYRGLEQLTCGNGLLSNKIPDRLEQWMIITREWRHIKMAKRAGRGHDPGGIESTANGTLTVPCRCCPIPGVNLPEGWDSKPDYNTWLYTLILAVDANFRQKARLRPGKHFDNTLGPGWGTFVENSSYLAHVSQYAKQDEISHCVGFSALWAANTKKNKGLRATGVAAVSCARHELFRPNGMGDLQLGERYCNMDYLLLSTLVISAGLLSIVVSYDIACQWGQNFPKRVQSTTIPAHLKHNETLNIRYLVPKFHLEAHTPKCHAPFSFNYAQGVGRTDGEGVERNWSVLNGIASSVSMMTPGGRWDVIDDFCNFSNWKKTLNIPNTLLRKMAQAIPQAIIHHRAYFAFTESLDVAHPQKAAEWEQAVTKWEKDHSLFCPYELPDQRLTFADVKRQLRDEEHEKVATGNEAVVLEEGMNTTEFVVTLLELEQAQQELSIDIREAPVAQRANYTLRRTNLLKRIQTFWSHQKRFLPGLAGYLERLNLPTPSKSAPELLPLYPPSAIPKENRNSICVSGLDSIEEKFRIAQASEALVQLRLQLAKRTCAMRYQSRNVNSQRYLTRFRELQKQTENRIKTAQMHYNTARQAIFELHGPGEWEKTYQVLNPSDIVGLGERILVAQEQATDAQMEALASYGNQPFPTTFAPQLARGEGGRVVSWIWHSTGTTELKDQSTDAYLRVEWLRCRARAQRWKEEIQLIEEEMRRAIEFCHWKVRWWNQKCDLRASTIDQHTLEGVAAYAAEQADVERQRAMDWTAKWCQIRQRAQDIITNHLKSEPEGYLESLTIEVEEFDDSGDIDVFSDDGHE